MNANPVPLLSPRQTGRLLLCILLMLSSASGVLAQDSGYDSKTQTNDVMVASVIIDGRPVMKLRGVSSYPANERARRVRNRIIEVARDDSFLGQKPYDSSSGR